MAAPSAPETDLTPRVAQDGFAVVSPLLSSSELAELLRAVEHLGPVADGRGGVRGVLAKSEALCRFAEEGPSAVLARAVLGPEARPVKGTLFDKTPGANWLVPWHQDLTIAVRERRDVPGFGPWSIKDGIVHVQPPAEVLARVLAIRVHLDETGPDNGALRVLPGSHLEGKLSDEDIERLRRERPERVCPVPAGGAMLMSPLLLHASSPSDSPHHRRVLHFEYAAGELPGALDWAT